MPAYTMSPVEPAKAALAKALALAEQIGDLQAQFQILSGPVGSQFRERRMPHRILRDGAVIARGPTHRRSVSGFDDATPARFRSGDAGSSPTVAGVLRTCRSALCRPDRSALDDLGPV